MCGGMLATVVTRQVRLKIFRLFFVSPTLSMRCEDLEEHVHHGCDGQTGGTRQYQDLSIFWLRRIVRILRLRSNHQTKYCHQFPMIDWHFFNPLIYLEFIKVNNHNYVSVFAFVFYPEF